MHSNTAPTFRTVLRESVCAGGKKKKKKKKGRPVSMSEVASIASGMPSSERVCPPPTGLGERRRGPPPPALMAMPCRARSPPHAGRYLGTSVGQVVILSHWGNHESLPEVPTSIPMQGPDYQGRSVGREGRNMEECRPVGRKREFPPSVRNLSRHVPQNFLTPLSPFPRLSFVQLPPSPPLPPRGASISPR